MDMNFHGSIFIEFSKYQKITRGIRRISLVFHDVVDVSWSMRSVSRTFTIERVTNESSMTQVFTAFSCNVAMFHWILI